MLTRVAVLVIHCSHQSVQDSEHPTALPLSIFLALFDGCDHVAATLLRVVEFSVGQADELVHVPRVGRVARDAEAEMQWDALATRGWIGTLDERVADTSSQIDGALGARIGQDGHELVATIAPYDIGVAYRGGQHRGYDAQHIVAGWMSIGVVKELEAVQIHHDQREDPPDPLYSVELLFQTAVEGAVVVEIGHRVPLGQVTRAVILPCVLDGHAELGSDCLGELQLRLVALRSRGQDEPESA